MRFVLQLLFVLALSLAASSAQARPALVVAEFPDAHGSGAARMVRNALVRALQRDDAVDVVPIAELKETARRERLSLESPNGLGRAAELAGADGVVRGRVSGRGRTLRLAVQVLDTKGRALWTKDVGVRNGTLDDALADRFARAFAAAIGVVAKSEPELAAIPVETEPARAEPGAVPETSETVAAVASAESELEPPVVARSEADRQEAPEPEPVAVAPAPSASLATSPDTKVVELPQGLLDPVEPRTPTGADVRPPDASEAADDSLLPRPPWIELLGTGTFSWRSYRFCPEVESCDIPSPVGAMAPVKYTTERPYSGIQLGGTFFPLRGEDNLLRGLGLSASYGRSVFLQTRYLDESRQAKVFGSRQQRIRGELLWRLYFRLAGTGDGYVGVSAGYLSHAFFVEPNPKIVDSRRGGLIAGVEASVPLHRFLSAEARFTGIPLANPGEKERKLYGSAVSGGGFTLQAGLSSDLGHPEWHVAPVALFEMTHFGDRYANLDGGSPRKGRALERYLGAVIGARASF